MEVAVWFKTYQNGLEKVHIKLILTRYKILFTQISDALLFLLHGNKDLFRYLSLFGGLISPAGVSQKEWNLFPLRWHYLSYLHVLSIMIFCMFIHWLRCCQFLQPDTRLMTLHVFTFFALFVTLSTRFTSLHKIKQTFLIEIVVFQRWVVTSQNMMFLWKLCFILCKSENNVLSVIILDSYLKDALTAFYS